MSTTDGGAGPSPASPLPADGISAWLSARTAIDVIPIRHPVIDAIGHHPTSDYAWFWLPVIGPSSLLAHRLITAGFVTNPNGYRVDLPMLGREIGLGSGVGRNAPIVRTVARLVHFDLAEIEDGRVGVSTSLPPLTRRQAARLPAHLANRHRQFVEHDQALLQGTRRFSAEAGW